MIGSPGSTAPQIAQRDRSAAKSEIRIPNAANSKRVEVRATRESDPEVSSAIGGTSFLPSSARFAGGNCVLLDSVPAVQATFAGLASFAGGWPVGSPYTPDPLPPSYELRRQRSVVCRFQDKKMGTRTWRQAPFRMSRNETSRKVRQARKEGPDSIRIFAFFAAFCGIRLCHWHVCHCMR
jgi:hypothetical protein